MFNILVLTAVTMALRIESLKETLPVMLIGMIGIFLVIGVIILFTYGLNKIFTKNKK